MYTGGEATYVYVPGRHEWVCVLPVTAEGNAVLLRQHRHIWGDYFLGLPGAAPTRTKRRKPPFGARFWRRRASRQANSSPCRDTAIWEAWWPRWAIPSWRSEFGKYSRPHQRELIKIIELPLEEVYEILYGLQGFRRGRGHHPAPGQTHPYRTRAFRLDYSFGKRARSRADNRLRKVRAAQGRMPANGWAG